MDAPSPEILAWCREVLVAGRTVLIGVNGPQGAGKSTLAAALVAALGQEGRRGFACSIDDFYLRFDEQRALAAAHPDNRYLELRGYPGTHDVALGAATLRALLRGADVRVPCYDKSAHGGRGDRAPSARWPWVPGPLDVVIFEGWMLGFQPAVVTDPMLVEPNRRLGEYMAWHQLIDAMILLEAPSLEQVVAWRLDAERARRDRGEGAMSEAETLDYIGRFLPAYGAWTPGLRARPPGRAVLRVALGPDRVPRAITRLPPAQ